MSLPGLCFRAVLPQEGFRWVIQDPVDGDWNLFSPPEDWPGDDYMAAAKRLDHEIGPELTERVFLATGSSGPDCEHFVYEPELYLQFASDRPTPANVLSMADRCGFLHLGLPTTALVEKAPALPGPLWSDGEQVRFYVERASFWLRAHERIRRRLERFAEWQANGDFAAIEEYLELDFNVRTSRSLSFGLHIDAITGELDAEMLAGSMADF